MTEFWGLVAVSLALAAACGTAIKLALDSRNDRVASAKLDARVQTLLLENGGVVRQLGAEAAARVDDQHRYEAVIAQQKAEIARLEGELDANLEPTAVRERLAGSGLLSSPAEGTAFADGGTAAGGLPPRPTAILGTGGGGSGRPL